MDNGNISLLTIDFPVKMENRLFMQDLMADKYGQWYYKSVGRSITTVIRILHQEVQSKDF